MKTIREYIDLIESAQNPVKPIIAWVEPATCKTMSNDRYENNPFANETGDWKPVHTQKELAVWQARREEKKRGQALGQNPVAEEQLDELSPETLKSYIKKSRGHSQKYDQLGNKADEKGDEELANKMWNKGDNRYAGDAQARNKLADLKDKKKGLPEDEATAQMGLMSAMGSNHNNPADQRRAMAQQAVERLATKR